MYTRPIGHVAAGVILLTALIYQHRIPPNGSRADLPFLLVSKRTAYKQAGAVSAPSTVKISWVLSRLSIFLTAHNNKANSSAYCPGM